MPQFLAYTYIMEAIEADIREVWPQVKSIHRGWPRVEKSKSLAYAVIWMDPENPVQNEARDGFAMIQVIRVNVAKIEPLPVNKSEGVQDRIVSDANLLIARIERDHRYAEMSSGAYAAQDIWANLGEIDEPGGANDQVFTVNVKLQCRVRELQTSKQGI